MRKISLPTLLLVTLLNPILFNWEMQEAVAQTSQTEASMAEDSFGQLPSWAGGDWPFSRVVQINDSLVNSPVGRVVLDKHGEEKCTELICVFKAPFAGPSPGRTVYLSIWGSKIEGCFAEFVLQIAPTSYDGMTLEGLVPTQLEIGIEDRIIQLPPQEAQPQGARIEYTYQKSQGTYSGVWFTVRQLFIIDESTANDLSNAPAKKLKARVKLANGRVILFPIGVETVKRWKSVYSFNPTCQNNS